MISNLSCLLVLRAEFPEEELSSLLAPEFSIEFDQVATLSEAFQFLLASNFNLCLIGAEYQDQLEPFFRDMGKIGRNKTCAFVKLAAKPNTKEQIVKQSIIGSGFCAEISRDLSSDDIKTLRNALSKEIVRISEELRAQDIPKYVELVLKEVDEVASKKQRGINSSYDKVIAGLVRDMMSDQSLHKEGFIEQLSNVSEKSTSFNSKIVEVPDHVLEKNLPKLNKSSYEGQSSRVWKKLLNKYGAK